MQDRVENNRVFRAVCAGMFLFEIAFITMGSVTADLREKFDLSQRDFGALFALLPLGIIAGTLWFGPEADRWGYKRVFLAAGFSLFHLPG